MKQGFALLNLMIGMVIASAVYMTLIQTIKQCIQYENTVIKTTNEINQLLTAHEYIERDVTQACLLHQATRNKKKAKKANKEAQKPAKNESKKSDTSEPKKQADSKEKQKTPLKECFFLETSNGKCTLSFISTSNHLIQWPELKQKNESYLCRITYLLEPDPLHKNQFRLIRKKGTDVQLNFYLKKPVTSSDLIVLEHVKTIQITAHYTISKPAKDKKKKPEIVVKTTTSWNDAFVYEETKEQPTHRIPHALSITYELLQPDGVTTNSYTQMIMLYPDTFYSSQKEPEPQIPQAPPEDKNSNESKKPATITLPDKASNKIQKPTDKSSVEGDFELNIASLFNNLLLPPKS